jgi:hypothetical protein
MESFIVSICGKLVSSASVRRLSSSVGIPPFGVGVPVGVAVGGCVAVGDGVLLGAAVVPTVGDGDGDGDGEGDGVGGDVGVTGPACCGSQSAATFGGSQPACDVCAWRHL